MKIKAFAAVRPSSNSAAQKLAAVPYDTVDTEEARALAAENPISFLRVSRSEIEFPAGTDPYSAPIYQRAVENFVSLQKQGSLIRESSSCHYLYRQKMGSHAQRGVVTCCSIEDYEKNIILKHEKTRKDKEDDRTRHLMTVQANTGPVFLAYRDSAALDRFLAEVEAQAPLYDFTAVDGIAHTVWRIPGDPGVLTNLFAAVPQCYIADGHHRAASAYRAGAERRAANAAHRGTEEYNWFLAVLFPASQLQILPYNRCVADLAGRSVEDFLEEVRKSFHVMETGAASPASVRNVSMYLAGKWWGISWDKPAVSDPIASLDVSVLQDRLLAPVLGVKDPRTDKRIDFVGGIRGTGELKKRVDSGRAAVAFSMHPVTIEQVMAVADAGMIMPPKSTWFEPKLRSGLLVHTI